MTLRNSPFVTLWGRGVSVAFITYITLSLLICEYGDHNIVRKELFYSWLLVFFNAYIGIFIANQAIRKEFTGFLVWGFLINGFRAGIFLIVLLSVIKLGILNVRGFVLITFFGYFAFLAAEIYGLHLHSTRIAKDPQCGLKDD